MNTGILLILFAAYVSVCFAKPSISELIQQAMSEIKTTSLNKDELLASHETIHALSKEIAEEVKLTPQREAALNERLQVS
ncbi:unnamed protein product [Strongylus vulgaris]|uniref:Uncharacterized protein n=1 Tax=Strongylus vulgaris TaxID=40348 RepID=A0A3P7IBE8_STRVU|nr:unnamed protein product [Strongylus vulgaris]